MSKIIAIILITVFLGVLGGSAYLLKQNKILQTRVSDLTINIKSAEHGVTQYRDKYDNVYSRVIEQRKTLAELTASKDSTITQLMQRLFAAGIKLKDIKGVSIETTKIERDTVIKWKQGEINKYYDFSKLPHIVNTVALTDSTATNKLQVNDTVSTIPQVKREFIEPRKSFFLARWFQKKQDVVYIDINHTNPFLNVTGNTQITILDSDGKAKK